MISNGLCEDLIPALEDSSIDAVITDPPYNISRNNNFNTMGRRGIDFGSWDKGADITSWLSICAPKLRPGGSVLVFNDWKNLGLLSSEAEKCGFLVKDVIRWIKDNPMPRNRDRRYVTDFEFLVWFVKPGGKWVFNRKNNTYDRPEYRFPAPGKSERVGHPTQKPVALMEALISTHTNEADTVLDPFMGSGTTGVACARLGRKFIGFESDKTSFQMARDRLDQE